MMPIGSTRRALATGLVAALALLAVLAAAATVIGKSRTVVHDKRGDGGGFEPRKRLGACDVLRATSELARNGRLRHTVTTRGKMRLDLTAAPVIITKRRARHAIGLASYVLSPGEPRVWSHLRNHRRTIVYFVKRSVIANAVGRRDRYFWVVDQCTIHGDRVPDRGSVKQRLRTRPRHR
jgi:hypothetical protein